MSGWGFYILILDFYSSKERYGGILRIFRMSDILIDLNFIVILLNV